MTATDRVIVASSDSHVSPPLADMRPYCEKRYLDDFDAYTSDFDEKTRVMNEAMRAGGGPKRGGRPPGNTLAMGGHGDGDARRIDMDREQIAAEVVFHGTQGDSRNDMHVSWPIPWVPSDRSVVAAPDPNLPAELMTQGRRIYNRWLADFCSVAGTDRLAGLCYISVWDIDASIEEIHWAKEHGLKGINFPSPAASFGGLEGGIGGLHSEYPPYENEYWDPLFAAAAEVGMPLTTHVGHPMLPPIYNGPAQFAITVFEQMPLSGRNLWHLIFSGAFERHPDLKLVVTEVLGPWWVNVILEMESMYKSTQAGPGEMLRQSIPKAPIEYVKQNVYFGCSFMARREAQLALEFDVADRVMWGSDYPHFEGTWHADDSVPPISPISLANTYHGFDEDTVRAMVGGNLVECYGLDQALLTDVAERVGPTIEFLSTEPDLSVVPSEYVGHGFRVDGLAHS
jgi:predicted TIM-barrel fold metal-dependent hydrolase